MMEGDGTGGVNCDKCEQSLGFSCGKNVFYSNPGVLEGIFNDIFLQIFPPFKKKERKMFLPLLY